MPELDSANAHVHIRICSPFVPSKTKDKEVIVNGLDEYFNPAHYGNSLSFLICSPWLEKDPFQLLESLLSKESSCRYRFYVLTFCDHKDKHLDSLKKTFRSILNRSDVDQFCIGFLPTQHNPKEFKRDVLHAKIYVLAKNAPEVNKVQPEDILEAFFGSANFTSYGVGGMEIGSQHEEHGSKHKFEIVARVQDDDFNGKYSIYGFFRKLWSYCDELQLGSTPSQDKFITSKERRMPSVISRK